MQRPIWSQSVKVFRRRPLSVWDVCDGLRLKTFTIAHSCTAAKHRYSVYCSEPSWASLPPTCAFTSQFRLVAPAPSTRRTTGLARRSLLHRGTAYLTSRDRTRDCGWSVNSLVSRRRVIESKGQPGDRGPKPRRLSYGCEMLMISPASQPPEPAAHSPSHANRSAACTDR